MRIFDKYYKNYTMKKTILLLITVFTIFNVNAQSGSWANYELVITPENTEKFMQAFDEFYQSEGAKKYAYGTFN